MIVFFILYQQLENHLLQPLVYNRTVALSPLGRTLIIDYEPYEVVGVLASKEASSDQKYEVVDIKQLNRRVYIPLSAALARSTHDGMAGSFLGRLFGSPRAGEPAVAEARAELDRLAGDRPALVPVTRWLRDMLPDLAPNSAPDLALEPEQARDKLKSGIPLLRGERLAVDLKAFRKRWQRKE